MSRRRRAEKREIYPDPKFGDLVISKFMNNLMVDGKKSVAEKIVYGALDKIEDKLKTDPVKVFHDAIENVMPGIIDIFTNDQFSNAGVTYMSVIDFQSG